jgi:hypothetical protein
VILRLERVAHAAALLPVLPWLERAGVEVTSERGGWRVNPAKELVALARVLGVEPPQIEWARRVQPHPPDLLLGTTDDLASLRALHAETQTRFVAVARLPLPVTVLSNPTAPGLALAAAEQLETDAGRLLRAGDADVVPALARRIGPHPFLLTGSPEVSLAAPLCAPGTWVVLYPSDLPLEDLKRDESNEIQERILERVLRPLAKTGRALEVRASLGAPKASSPEALRAIVARVAKLVGLARDAVRVRDHEGFSTLAAAGAVLALTERDLLRGLAAGAERVAYLAFALAPDLRVPPSEGVPCRLGSGAEYGSWVAQDSHRRPSEAAVRIAQVLGALSGAESPQRAAQAVLSAVSDF